MQAWYHRVQTTWSCKTSTYVGQVHTDKGTRHGRGVITWADGTQYEGEWCDGKRHGCGVFAWADRQLYEGEFVEGKRHGHGAFTWADGRRLEGECRDGKVHGRGVMWHSNIPGL